MPKLIKGSVNMSINFAGTEANKIKYNNESSETLTATTVEDAINELDDIKINTDDLKTALIDIIYPIGSIYMSVNSVSPEVFLGGEWEQIKDTFLLSSGDSREVGVTGGEETHTLTTAEMPSHNHIFTGSAVNTGENNVGHTHTFSTGWADRDHTHSGNTGWVSADHTHYTSGNTSTTGNHSHTSHYWNWGLSLASGASNLTQQGNPDLSNTVSTGNAGNHYHSWGNWSGGASANHYHGFTTGGQSQSHTHSGTTADQSANHIHSVTAAGSISASGDGNAMNNMPPYLTVNMWKRIK